MKLRNIIVLLLALILVVSFTGSAFAEPEQEEAQISPHFVYTICTDNEISGIVDLSEDGGAYYVRLTFFQPFGTFFIVVVPVVDGAFNLRISCDTEYIAMQLVDKPDAFLPSDYNAFDSLGYTTGRTSGHPPDAR